MSSLSRRINRHFAHGDYRRARTLLRGALRKKPKDHWLLTRLSATYYEERKYKTALRHSGRALKLAPRCPLVLWDYAGALDMLGNTQGAMRIWKRLLWRGEESIAYGECGEGVRWARSLLNDCRYRLALGYADLGRTSMAIRYLWDHIANRAPGISSNHSLSEAKRFLAELQMKQSRSGVASGSRR